MREWMYGRTLLLVSISNLFLLIHINIYIYIYVAELVQSACPSNVYRLVYLSILAVTEYRCKTRFK